MASIMTASGRIGFEEAGGGPATPIIFLHGVGSDKSVWQAQLAHFGKIRRSVAFDYPGYGESELLADATRDDFAKAILAAMDRLDIAKAHVCGLSLGGVVALAMHHAAPDRCSSLIIADSFAVHPDGQAIHDRSVAASRAMTMGELANARAGLLLGSQATPELRGEIIATMGRINPAAYRLGAAAVWLANQCDRARAVDVPTLILVGVEDMITPPALSQDLQAMIAQSQLVEIVGAGHLANVEQSARFNGAIESFFASLGN
ncbi:alpha/beta fold hydrolase [Sphingomonas xanthus]|nr:alpha/beta fold hydrolase [Sphingomonas xanthus]